MKGEALKISLMYEFRTQLLNFLDELIEQFPEESDLITRMTIEAGAPTGAPSHFLRESIHGPWPV